MADPRQRSKKRSSSKKPKLFRGFTLYLCHNLDYDDVATVLERNGIRFKRHRDFFDGWALDTELLPLVGKRRWILITFDQKQRTRLLERQLIKRYKIREFVFTSGKIGDIGSLLVAARRQMRNLCSRNEGPFVASISQNARVILKTLD
jgi:PIN like domain